MVFTFNQVTIGGPDKIRSSLLGKKMMLASTKQKNIELGMKV